MILCYRCKIFRECRTSIPKTTNELSSHSNKLLEQANLEDLWQYSSRLRKTRLSAILQTSRDMIVGIKNVTEDFAYTERLLDLGRCRSLSGVDFVWVVMVLFEASVLFADEDGARFPVDLEEVST